MWERRPVQMIFYKQQNQTENGFIEVTLAATWHSHVGLGTNPELCYLTTYCKKNPTLLLYLTTCKWDSTICCAYNAWKVSFLLMCQCRQCADGASDFAHQNYKLILIHFWFRIEILTFLFLCWCCCRSQESVTLWCSLIHISFFSQLVNA